MTSQHETNLWSTHVNIVRLAEPIRRCVRWRTQVFKIEGFVCKRFLPSPPPPPSFTFWLSFHFSRGQNRKSPSSVFLCSETKWKRLLRRLMICKLFFFFLFSAQTTVVVPGVLAETAETGNKNCCVTEATHVLRRKLRFRAFPERFCPRILSLENVDYFEIRELFGGRKKKENYNYEKANCLGLVNCHCMQMNLVLSMRFIFGDDWNDAPCSHQVFYLWQWCNFSLIEALEFSCNYTLV